MTENKTSIFRIGVLLIGTLAVFGGLIGRLYYLQIICAQDVKDRSSISRTYYLNLPAVRGLIEDRNGRPLALNAYNFNVEADKVRMDDIEDAIHRVGAMLDMSQAEQERHIDALRRPTIKGRVLQRNIDEETRNKIEAEKIPGITFSDHPVRLYPEGKLAAHLLGYTGSSNRGLDGLEFQLNDKLQGTPHQILTKKDSARRLLADNDYTKIITRGADVVLTIDSYIQFIVEREIEKARREFGALYANAVVMHPKSGEILAMANSPTFDPNHYNDYAESVRKNRLITDIYEPGSVIKPFTILAALEHNVVTPETVFYCEKGNFRFFGRTIRDDIHRFDDLSVHDILVRSSNIGTVKIAQRLVPGDWRGQSKILYDYLRRFGFKHAGEKTLSDLPGDSGGILRPPHQWQPASIGAIPYGQEMATNTLCLAVAYSALANRGMYQPPQIIKGYKTADDLFYPKASEEAYRVVGEENTEKVIDMMIDVTEDPEGTGRNTRIPGYHLAAKTGTAQKMGPQGGGYGKGLRIGTFAGFFPAEDPQVAIVVMVDEPKKKKYGGDVAAPAWKAIAEEIIAYWGIPPSHTNDPLLAQQKQAKKTKTAEQTMKADLDKSRTFGVTRTLRITPENAPQITESTMMPNLVGMPIRDAYALLTQMGITATFSGSGKVVRQETPAGTIIQDRHKTGIILCEPMLTDPDVDTGSSMLAKG